MPFRALPAPAFAGEPFLGSAAVAAGLITPRQLRARCLRRICRDVYVDATVPDSPQLRVAVAKLVIPKATVISGPAAAWLQGASVGIDPNPIEVTGEYDERFRGRRGIRRRHAALDDGDVVDIGGMAVTSPLRTAFDLSRRYDLLRGTAAVDAMLNRKLVSPDEFVTYVAEHRGWTGVPKARYVCRLMDPGAESVKETRLRLTFVWGGLPRPETQVEVYDEFGRLVARLDLGWRDRRAGSEYDGAQHFETSDAVARDLARHNELIGLGWTVPRFAGQVVHRFPLIVVRQMAEVLGVEPHPTQRFRSC